MEISEIFRKTYHICDIFVGGIWKILRQNTLKDSQKIHGVISEEVGRIPRVKRNPQKKIWGEKICNNFRHFFELIHWGISEAIQARFPERIIREIFERDLWRIFQLNNLEINHKRFSSEGFQEIFEEISNNHEDVFFSVITKTHFF